MPKGAFEPDERGIGGVLLLRQQFSAMQGKISAPSKNRGSPSNLPTAASLSANRAMRRANTDQTSINHLSNVFHMHRHIEEQQGGAESRRNPMHGSAQAVARTRPSNRSSMLHGMSHWMPQSQQRDRPHSAPVKNSSSLGGAITMPNASRYVDVATNSDYSIYYRVIMGEILEKRLYKEIELKKLFSDFIKHCASHHRFIVRQVIDDIKGTLNMK